MDLTSPQAVKELLQKNGAWASKGLGQHFLIDRGALNAIIEAANLGPEDTVLEIGPGLGTLTRELAPRVKKVVAVEKDANMAAILEGTLKGCQNVEIIQKDVLKIKKLEIRNYKLVANLPYYITSPVIRKFLEADNPSEIMVLMIQKEVAQRIVARPPKMSLLAVSVQFYADPKIVSYVPKESFWPRPKVDSAIIKIMPKFDGKSATARNLADLFFHIVRAGFSQPRKQLINNFCTRLNTSRDFANRWLTANDIQPSQRAETLNVNDWLNLAKSFTISQWPSF